MSRQRPLIAVSVGRRGPGAGSVVPRVRPGRAEVVVAERVVERVRDAGGHVLLLPPGDPAILGALNVDAWVLTGGAFDIHPRHYGRAADPSLGVVDEARTVLELEIARHSAATGQPLLGLCGGMQAMAVALGGTLIQDIGTMVPGALEHEQPTDPAEPWHEIRAEGRLSGWIGSYVNSTHHQAVEHPGPLSVTGRCADGVIEALELPGHRFFVGVQWHPEWLAGGLFEALVAACR